MEVERQQEIPGTFFAAAVDRQRLQRRCPRSAHRTEGHLVGGISLERNRIGAVEEQVVRAECAEVGGINFERLREKVGRDEDGVFRHRRAGDLDHLDSVDDVLLGRRGPRDGYGPW